MSSLLSLFLFSCIPFIVNAIVPQNETFNFVNSGELGPYIVEYGADYRMISIFNAPFQVGFYNTTPNAYTLALRVGLQRSESLFRWVWEANRGNPVGENATFSLGSDGNLKLAHANGKIAWQTNTSNKGVVAFKLLPNGNMVLLNSQGKFIWQSFDHPTDTLLVGQSLKASGPSKLVSRLSEKENIDGPYSLVLEPKELALYYKSKNSPRAILYWTPSDRIFIEKGSTLANVTLTSDPESFEITLDYYVANSSNSGNRFLGRPVNNTTLTYLRLGIDGNIKLHTYFLDVRSGVWQVTYTLFDRDSDESECQLPERCGNFGLCDDNQCVACPLEKGLFGWSKNCTAPNPTSTTCKTSGFHYYKVEGVEHYMSKYTSGDSVSESTCGTKCSKDCKCVGYFYHKDKSRCWVAYDLQTLTKAANSTHVGFIKVADK